MRIDFGKPREAGRNLQIDEGRKLLRAQILGAMRVHAAERQILIAAGNILRQRYRPVREIFKKIESGIGGHDVAIRGAAKHRRPQDVRRFLGTCAAELRACLVGGQEPCYGHQRYAVDYQREHDGRHAKVRIGARVSALVR